MGSALRNKSAICLNSSACLEEGTFSEALQLCYITQGSHKAGKPGIVREFCKLEGKVREFEIWSGNFL